MRSHWYHSITAIALIALLADVSWAQPTPGYNNKIPESIMTPNDIETRAGTLKYFDGIPTPETAKALYNHLDYIRGVEAFINGMPQPRWRRFVAARSSRAASTPTRCGSSIN